MSMNHDDVLKLKAAVLYVVNKCGEIGYMHLFKILYFANREHYAKYGRSIINDTFCALPKGPVPSFLYDAVKPNVSKSGDLKIIFDSLSEKSHDIAWKEAWDKGPARPMMNLSIAKAGGANRAMLEYIKENELIDSIIG